MVTIRNYKMVACDVDNPSYSREFTCALKLHAWMRSDDNKHRKMDFCTPQEHRWLLEQPKTKETINKIEKKKPRTKIIEK